MEAEISCQRDAGWGPQVSAVRLPHHTHFCDLSGPQTGWSWNPLSQSPSPPVIFTKGTLRPKRESRPRSHSQLVAELGSGPRVPPPTGTPPRPSLSFGEHSTISELEEALRIWCGDSQGAIPISQDHSHAGRVQARRPLSSSQNQPAFWGLTAGPRPLHVTHSDNNRFLWSGAAHAPCG